MSNIFRKSYTLPIPVGAELVTVKGVPSARFKHKGKTLTAPLTKRGDRVRVQSPSYYGTVDGKPIKLFTDAVASQQRLAELIRKSERKESGVADPFEEHRRRPICEHLDDYRRSLDSLNNCAEHIAQTTARITAIICGCKFERIADLDSEKVAEFLHDLRRNPPRPVLPVGQIEFTPAELTDALGGNRPVKLSRVIDRERLDPGSGNGPRRRYPRATVERLQDIYCRGISIATSNGYLTAIKGFSKWLFRKERIDRDRLAALSRLKNTEVRHSRRALDEGELNRLLASAWNSGSTFEGLTGHDRAMIYLLAMSSGLRASELASLTPSSFTLTTDRSLVTVRAAYTKNRDEAQQPLPADVAASFHDYLQGRPAMAAIWPGKWNEFAAEMLRSDLESAGIEYRDENGAVADFHALRHSYISLLGSLGNSPKVTQTLARHSDIRLTMNVYSHAQIHDLAAAVEGLPIGLPGVKRSAEVLLATGTDNRIPHHAATYSRNESKRLPFPCRKGDGSSGNMRGSDDANTGDDGGMETSQPIAAHQDDEGSDEMSEDDEETTPPGFEPGQREPKYDGLNGVDKAKTKANDISLPALAVSLPFDPELARLVEVWPTLPDAIKAGIRAMIDATRLS